MERFKRLSIASDFTIELVPEVPLSLTVKQQEEAWTLWNVLQLEGGTHFFNGTILNCCSLTSKKMVATFVDYAFFIAQQRLPHLRETLTPVAISGWTQAGDATLIGQRASFVAHNPNCYELVPSGGIDDRVVDGSRVDFRKQAFLELKEEAGLTADKITPLFIAKESNKNVIELCLHLSLPLRAALTTPTSPSGEYQQLMWLTPNELRQHVASHTYVPLSLFILDSVESHKFFE